MNTENSRTNYDRRNLSPSLPNLWTIRLSYLIELAIQLVHRNHLNISLFLKNYSSCWDASNRFILLHKISTLVGRYNVVLVNCYNRAIHSAGWASYLAIRCLLPVRHSSFIILLLVELPYPSALLSFKSQYSTIESGEQIRYRLILYIK